jgi:hypothetical protein
MKEAAKPDAPHDATIPHEERRKIATDEVAAVTSADYLWLLVPSYNGSKGSWVELGVAIGANRTLDARLGRFNDQITILCSGDYRGSLFTSAVGIQCFDEHEHAYQFLIGRS